MIGNIGRARGPRVGPEGAKGLHWGPWDRNMKRSIDRGTASSQALRQERAWLDAGAHGGTVVVSENKRDLILASIWRCHWKYNSSTEFYIPWARLFHSTSGQVQLCSPSTPGLLFAEHCAEWHEDTDVCALRGLGDETVETTVIQLL